MNDVWQVQEAKSRLSELLDRVVTDGPQVITRHGRPVAKVVPMDTGAGPSANDGFLEFLLSAPKLDPGESLPEMPRRSRRKSPFEDD